MSLSALYFRQSLDVSEGIDRQRERCRKLAADRGWTVVAEYEDNNTSASKARGANTGWGRMLAARSRGEIDTVIAVDLDRLIRSQRDLLTLIDAGLTVVTVDGEVDLSTADGEFRASVVASVARFEVRRKSERQKRADAHRAAQGVPRYGGMRAFGYEQDGMTPREPEAHWVREAFKRTIAGDSIWSTVRALNAAGMVTSTGGKFTPQNLRQMLRREKYKGVLVVNGERMPESKIQPVVSADDFDLVQNILASRSETVGRKPELNWLSSLIVCSVCGEPMVARNQTAGKGKPRVRTYMCKSKRDRTSDGERHVTIAATLAETKVKVSLYGHMSAGWIAKPEVGADVRKLQEQIADTRMQRAKVQDMFTLPGADTDWCKRRIAELGAHIERLEAERAGLVARDAEGSTLAAVLDELPDWDDLVGGANHAIRWLAAWDALPVEKRRAVVDTMYRLTVTPGGKGDKRLNVELVA